MQKLRMMHHTPRANGLTMPIYVGLFFLAFHYYLIVYINSNFLSTFSENDTVISFLFIAGSLASVVGLLSGPKLIRKIGCTRLALYATALEIVSLLLLAHAESLAAVAFAFLLQHIANPLILFCLDEFLESTTENSESGKIRGVYLTILNSPAVIGALLSGLILIDAEYYKVYIASAICILPLMFLLLTNLRRFHDPVYKQISLGKAMARFDHNSSLRDIFIDTTLLHTFYALATIYLPIYLHQVIGFTLGEIGIMFSIALLPFLFLQIPVGNLADKKLGEKEFLVWGFLIMSLSTILISFIESNSFLVWTIILVCTRIGAAIVEIATESFFFKQVDKTDADVIGLFRMAHSVAFVTMPILGIAALMWISVQWFFLCFGLLILILGLRYAFDLKDTK